MKALLHALWTDPKVASGLLMMIVSLVGLFLSNPHADIPSAIGQALLNLAGGGLLLHAGPPKADAPAGTSGPSNGG